MNERRKHIGLGSSLLLLVFTLMVRSVFGQCSTTITTFPYTESFEAAPAWASGGTNNDWAWGAPAHPTINGAADGANAWCVGGLTGSFYSNGQQSWLETPCFDLSGLSFPWITFNIWWETEPNYDGIGFQYSSNGGTTWINVGVEGGSQDCHTRHWFNTSNITALNQASPKQGWSGTSTSGGCAGGGGSNGYVPAAHCLADLPVASPVKFRFIFGAGTICNTFDGVAIDDIYIGEAPALDPDFDYTCAGSIVNFSATGIPGCVENGTWNFGDPASGGANTGSGTNIAHTFSGPGEYTVSFTMTSSCSTPATVQRTVRIGALDFVVTNVGCVPNSGAVTVNVTGVAGPFTYEWDPGGGTTGTIDGLAAGVYTVLVEALDMCPLQASATVGTDTPTISATATHTDASCAAADDGTATVSVVGGSGTYTYAWSPTGGAGAVATDLAPGVYTCEVEDGAGCAAQVQVTIGEPPPVVVVAMADASICAGQSLTLTATTTGGVGVVTSAWSPEGPIVTPTTTTTYSVQATDANGCTSEPDEVVLSVTAGFVPSFTWDIDEGCGPLCVTFTDGSGVAGTRAWNFSDGGSGGDQAQVEHCFSETGTFGASLTITSVDGCSGTFGQEDIITVLPSPSARFTASPVVAMIDDPVFNFTGTGAGVTTWLWSFGDPLGSTSEDPTTSFRYPDVGCYTVGLDVSSAGGCTDHAEAMVCVEDAFALYAPNCFTPDDDEVNDRFKVITTLDEPHHLSIFDRWGRLVYNTSNGLEGWDGSGLPQGIYAWRVSVRDRGGDIHEHQGHVTLLR